MVKRSAQPFLMSSIAARGLRCVVRLGSRKSKITETPNPWQGQLPTELPQTQLDMLSEFYTTIGLKHDAFAH